MQRTVTALIVATIVVINMCIVLPVSAESLGERTLKYGLSGDDVIQLQGMLKDLGYFSASVTGYYGNITRSAVINFQQAAGLTVDGIAGPQTFATLTTKHENLFSSLPDTYVVQAGDSLWKISNRFGISIQDIKRINRLTSDYLYVGQRLKLKNTGDGVESSICHVVQRGESLWLIASNYNITVEQLRTYNNLSSDTIYVGQQLYIPRGSNGNPGYRDVQEWPSVTYIVQPDDTVGGIALRFGVSASDIMKYNYMETGEWLDAGEKIAISGYAPRTYSVIHGEASAPATVGKLVDWFLEGQYLLKRWDVFTLVDCRTGRQFRVKMMGGYNHSDIEPLTANDTAIMKEIFNYEWKWSPRSVVIFHDGMNMAASLSGMPHSADTLTGNGVSGHFDLYLLNSKPHGSASSSYVSSHTQCIMEAARK